MWPWAQNEEKAAKVGYRDGKGNIYEYKRQSYPRPKPKEYLEGRESSFHDQQMRLKASEYNARFHANKYFYLTDEGLQNLHLEQGKDGGIYSKKWASQKDAPQTPEKEGSLFTKAERKRQEKDFMSYFAYRVDPKLNTKKGRKVLKKEKKRREVLVQLCPHCGQPGRRNITSKVKCRCIQMCCLCPVEEFGQYCKNCGKLIVEMDKSQIEEEKLRMDLVQGEVRRSRKELAKKEKKRKKRKELKIQRRKEELIKKKKAEVEKERRKEERIEAELRKHNVKPAQEEQAEMDDEYRKDAIDHKKVEGKLMDVKPNDKEEATTIKKEEVDGNVETLTTEQDKPLDNKKF